jgi:hypothetical protein
MNHAEKDCVICGERFKPRPTLSSAQAKAQLACGYKCAGALRRRRYKGGKQSADQRFVGEYEKCQCTSCKKLRAETAERLAKLPPAAGRTAKALAARAALIRRRVLAETLSPYGE